MPIDEVELVREIYKPSDLWSHVGQRLSRGFLFYRQRLVWSQVMRQFTDEFTETAKKYGSSYMLEGTGEQASSFIARLVGSLYRKRLLSEQEKTMLWTALESTSEFKMCRNSYAQAVILKACFEIGLLRPPRRQSIGVSVFNTMEDVRTVEELLTYPLQDPLPRRAVVNSLQMPVDKFSQVLRKARTIPEYHLVVAHEYSDHRYHQAVRKIGREFDFLDEAFNVLKQRSEMSTYENVFVEKYDQMSEQIH